MLSKNQLAAEDHLVFSEYLCLLEYKLSRREEMDRKIEELALLPFYKPTVDRLKCFRGIETHAAMVLASEMGDWRRFESPRQLMAYLGLVPSETPREIGANRGASPRAATATAGMCWCRRPGATAIRPIAALR